MSDDEKHDSVDIDCIPNKRIAESIDNDGKTWIKRSDIPYVQICYKAVVEVLERQFEKEDWTRKSIHVSRCYESKEIAEDCLDELIDDYCIPLKSTSKEYEDGKRRTFVACIQSVLELVEDYRVSSSMTGEDFRKYAKPRYMMMRDELGIEIIRARRLFVGEDDNIPLNDTR